MYSNHLDFDQVFSLIQGAATQLQYWICTENLMLNAQIICHQLQQLWEW